MGEDGLSITAVLATLETQDPTAAHALRVAFGPFTARQRPTTITEEWVAQTLVGEPPPVASLTGLTRGEVVAALARAFEVLGLPRHAALLWRAEKVAAAVTGIHEPQTHTRVSTARGPVEQLVEHLDQMTTAAGLRAPP